VPGLKNPVERAYLLGDKRHAIAAQNGPNGVTLTLPAIAPDPVSSTIVVKVKGALDIDQPVLAQQADGTILLPASEARVHGDQLRYESGSQRDNLGFWFNPTDWADWEFNITRPARFDVEAQVAAPEAASVELQVKGQKLQSEAPATGDYGIFKWTRIGTVAISAKGRTTVSVRGVSEGWHPLNLKAIRLTPSAISQP